MDKFGIMVTLSFEWSLNKQSVDEIVFLCDMIICPKYNKDDQSQKLKHPLECEVLGQKHPWGFVIGSVKKLNIC